MSSYILPVLLLIVILVGVIKRVNIYDSFVQGMRSSIELIMNIAPYLLAIMVMIELFEVSGLNKVFERLLSPILHLFGIPSELTSLIIIRPISGSGSLAILENILRTYGADSYVGRCASIIAGASETIFYVTVLYFSTSKVKKLRYAIPVALISSFAGVVVGCLLARLM